jgi:hypothetical protein
MAGGMAQLVEFFLASTIKKKVILSQAWWCISVIPATREAETGKDLIQGQPWAKSLRLYLKNN